MPHTRLRLPDHPSTELPPNSPSITVFQVRYEMQIFKPLKCEESRRMCVVVSRFFSFNTQCWRCFRCSHHDLVGRMCRLENQDQEAPNIFRDILRLGTKAQTLQYFNQFRCPLSLALWTWQKSVACPAARLGAFGPSVHRSGRPVYHLSQIKNSSTLSPTIELV